MRRVDIDALERLEREATPGEWDAVLENDPRGQPVAYYRAIIGLLANKDDGGYLSVVASDDRRVGSDEHAGCDCDEGATMTRLLSSLEAALWRVRAIVYWRRRRNAGVRS